MNYYASQFLSEKNHEHTKRKEFLWSISSSVTNLFEILDEEINGDDDEDEGNDIDVANSPALETAFDDADIEEEEQSVDEEINDNSDSDWDDDYDINGQKSTLKLFEILDDEIKENDDDDDDPDDDWDNHHGMNSANPVLPKTSFENKNMKEEDQDEYIVSDAEALLACWSYLRRRKRAGEWDEHEERKAQKELSQNYFLTEEETDDIMDDDDEDDDDEDEDISEDNDIHLNFDITSDGDSAASIATVQDILSGTFDGGGSNDDDIAEDLRTISSFISDKASPSAIRGTDIETTGKKRNIDLWYTEFTSFPTEPSESRTRRVNAMKKRWEDPAYRERWYERRWGSKSNYQRKKYDEQTNRERKAIHRARSLPSSFLGSDELASMTEEEIADAIRIRIESTRKRVAKRKQTLQGRKDALAAQMKDLKILLEEGESSIDKGEDDSQREIHFLPTTETLKEIQKKRSERAKNLYATRLENKERERENQSRESSSIFPETSPVKRNKGPYFPPKQLTPKDAFLRIENDLDNGAKPNIEDVHLILEPIRMKNRKELFRRILLECFNLRGKCVPVSLHYVDEHEVEHELEFVTTTTVKRLGAFVVHLLSSEDPMAEKSKLTE